LAVGLTVPSRRPEPGRIMGAIIWRPGGQRKLKDVAFMLIL
jgi:hypothetical protein